MGMKYIRKKKQYASLIGKVFNGLDIDSETDAPSINAVNGALNEKADKVAVLDETGTSVVKKIDLGFKMLEAEGNTTKGQLLDRETKGVLYPETTVERVIGLQAQIDGINQDIAGKAPTVHTHDDRYYTEAEVDTKLNAKLNTTGNASNVTNTFTQATTLSNLTSGEKLSASLGKIMKAIADLISHIGNKANPHGVTKAQVGLGNVTNDAQVKRSEMGIASGVATLGTDAKVPTEQLPSSALLALGETSSTAYAGNKGKTTTDNVDAILAGTKAVPKAKDTEMFDGHTSQYYGKQTDVTAIKSQLNRNLITLTNSSYYPQTNLYRSGQVCYLRCAGYLAKDVTANSELTIGTASMMPSEYRPGTDLVFYITVINNGTIIEVRIYTDGRVTFVSPQKLIANTAINLHLSYQTGKSNF